MGSDIENGGLNALRKENPLGRTAQNLSASLVPKRSDPSLVLKVRFCMLRIFPTNLQEGGESNEDSEEKPVIGFLSAFIWLIGMTITIALLSEYVVDTIEAASDSWGISVSFISIILLPIVGNAAGHGGSIIFALKNKLDISLDVSLGSASQISMFVCDSSV